MGIKRHLRKKRKELGGQLRKSVDKSVLAAVEKGLRPVRQQTRHLAIHTPLRARGQIGGARSRGPSVGSPAAEAAARRLGFFCFRREALCGFRPRPSGVLLRELAIRAPQQRCEHSGQNLRGGVRLEMEGGEVGGDLSDGVGRKHGGDLLRCGEQRDDTAIHKLPLTGRTTVGLLARPVTYGATAFLANKSRPNAPVQRRWHGSRLG
jgi:hypothetical protein